MSISAVSSVTKYFRFYFVYLVHVGMTCNNFSRIRKSKISKRNIYKNICRTIQTLLWVSLLSHIEASLFTWKWQMIFSMQRQEKLIHILPSCMSWWLSMRGTRLWRLPWQCIDVPQTNWRPAGLWWGGPNRPAKRGWGRGSVTRETLKKGEDQFKAGDMCWYLPLTTAHFKLFLILQCMKKKNRNVHKHPCILPPTNNGSFQILFIIL